VKHGFEWTPGLVLLGIVLVLPLVPSFALIGIVVVALAAIVALAALAGAMLAMPYLLAHHLGRRWLSRSAARQASVWTTRATGRLGAARLHPRPKVTRSR
jgi:hypothetical protein